MTGLSTVKSESKSRSGEAVRMLAAGLQLEEIDHIDKANLQVREFLAQQRGRGQRLLRRNIAGRGHDHVGLAGFVVARPIPDADALGAMRDRRIHVHELQMLLLVADDHVDVVLAAQAMIGDRQQAIDVGRQVDARDVGALVDHHIEEAGILMGEAVVILPPHGRGDQQVQRGDRLAPRQMVADLQPLGVLVEHRVDDVHERFVGREESVPAGEQIAFEHAFHGVLAEHLHHAAVGREIAAVGVFREVFLDPEFLADFVDGVELVRGGLVGPEDAEVVRVHASSRRAERRPAGACSRPWSCPACRTSTRSRGNRAGAALS